jgi:hypothetical protein
MGKTMSSKPKTNPKPETEKIPSEIEFLNRYKCVEERKESKTYTIYNCDASLKVNKDNIRDVIEQALNIAQQFNAVIRLFRVINYDAMHTVSITVTRGGLITIDIRFPQRVGGYQNVLTVRVEEIGALKTLVDKLAELAQALGL